MKTIVLLEVRRQVAHLCFGILLTLLIFNGYINSWFLAAANITFLSCIVYWKSARSKNCIFKKLLSFFERDEHIVRFPGRGLFFFLLGSYGVVLFLPQEIALASILILSVGDSVSHIYGRFFGKIKIPFFPQKNVEGHIVGLILSAFAATIFVPFFPALFAALFGMIAEIPHLKIGKFPLDDNFLIPIVSGIVLSIWNSFFPFI